MSEATSSQQKGRPTNAINVTTSETIRVDGDRNNLHLQPMPIGSVSGQVGVGTTYPHKKKTTSFQITSVTSRDGGEDSADDTEELSEIMDSSKVTDFDQETPTSFSEDTYSKSEDVFFGPAPVIPTSSQYGITALVQQPGTGGVMTARLPQGVTVNVTEGGIALAKADGEPDDVEQWQNRFKIVKIDSTEPFKRGRWTCLDFMDSPAGTANACPSKDEVPSLIVNSINSREPEAPEQQPQTVLRVCIPTATQQQQQSSVQQPTHSQYASQTPQPIAGQPPNVTTMVPTPQVAPSLVSIQSGQHGVTQQGAPPGMGYPPTNVVPTQAPPTMVAQGYATSSQTPQGSVHPSPSAQTPPQTQPPMQQPQPHQQPQAPPQGISAQAPSVSQTNLVQAVHSHPSDIQQVNAPVSSIPPGSIQPGVVPSTSLPQAATHQQQPGMGTQSLPQQGMAAQNISIPQQSGGMAQPAAVKAQNLPQQNLPQNVPQQVMSGVPQQAVGMAPTGHPGMVSQGGGQALPQQPIQPTNLTGQLGPPPTMPTKPSVTTQNMVTTQQIPGTGAMPVQPGGGGAMPSVTSQPNVGAPPVSYNSLPSAGGTTTPATTPAQPQAHLNVGSAPQVPTSVTPAQQSAPPTHNVVGGGKDQLGHEGGTPGTEDPGAAPSGAHEDSESASNASTVAIDNKIEQAMDLVKSHLMFAVREEVEVLKEKIGELMDRISQLEYENTVLRQCATQDALQQISQQHPSSNT